MRCPHPDHIQFSVLVGTTAHEHYSQAVSRAPPREGLHALHQRPWGQSDSPLSCRKGVRRGSATRSSRPMAYCLPYHTLQGAFQALMTVVEGVRVAAVPVGLVVAARYLSAHVAAIRPIVCDEHIHVRRPTHRQTERETKIQRSMDAPYYRPLNPSKLAILIPRSWHVHCPMKPSAHTWTKSVNVVRRHRTWSVPGVACAPGPSSCS